MFIKSLKISGKNGIIRQLNFHKGLNLIVDDTPIDEEKATGNNVGKTTVLKLIYFCLGGDGKYIYTDEENSRGVYSDVRDFLINEEILITLELVDDLNDDSTRRVIVERNFLPRNKSIRKINGEGVTLNEFDQKLKEVIFPKNHPEKPTFKQIVSHNIRYHNYNIENTLKTLPSMTKNVEYETLYLYLFGFDIPDGNKKQELDTKISQEKIFKSRLEKNNSRSAYEASLNIINSEIKDLELKKASLNLNENFESDLQDLNECKYEISKVSSSITKLEIKKSIIQEAEKEMKINISNVDIDQLKLLYSECKLYLNDLTKTFEDLVNYHNNMIVEKINYITKDLPSLIKQIDDKKDYMQILLEKEKSLSLKVSKSDSFEDLERIISEINVKYQKKGEYESAISQIDDSIKAISCLEQELNEVNRGLYTKDFEDLLKDNVYKFNQHFSRISDELYGEKYALKVDVKTEKKGNKYYKFDAFNVNMSSGKKQGEILCFDLAYTLFADEQNIPCLHFLLNDKKELVDDHQLLKVADFVKDKNVQLVISMLKDKLPSDLNNEANIILELSQNDKLFRIENN